MWVADEDQGVSSPVLPVFSREPDVPMCTEGGKEGLGGVQPIYGEPERQAWMKDAEWPALRVNQLKVTQRSRHSPLSTRQSGAGWEHRKQQMVGTRAAGMAFLVISFSCSLRFSELGVWEQPEAGGQAAEGDGDAAQQSQAERLCLLFPASCFCTKLCAGVMPIPCAYAHPLEPGGLPLPSPCLGL